MKPDQLAKTEISSTLSSGTRDLLRWIRQWTTWPIPTDNIPETLASISAGNVLHESEKDLSLHRVALVCFSVPNRMKQ